MNDNAAVKRLTYICVALTITTTIEIMEAFFGYQGMNLLG